jgi:hypothetical protein
LVTHDFVCVMKINVQQLENPVTLQLGGSVAVP